MTVNIGTIEGLIILRDQFSGVIDKAAGKLSAASGKLSKIGSNMSSIGATLSTRITVPLAAMGGASLKFATDFESSFAGVRKTVDATEEQFSELETGFRNLSKQIPINVNEINSIGEAAGQLGIKTENILGFTRVMADLGVATNLSSDQAATALARLANITGLPQTQFDRLGSTIVALGNNFATTESEIVEMGLRLAGAGSAVGMTEGQILALSTALTSVGINAEAGGSAFSRVIKDMTSSVAVGGDAVKGFADVAGVSISEFSRLFREDAASALTLFVEGLGRMTAEDKLLALDKLGLSGIRVGDALIRTSGAGTLLADALDLQAVAWRENTALTKEAEQRYSTFESKLTIFWNRLKDLGITLGNIIIPKISALIDGVAPLIDKFQNLTTGTQSLILTIGGIAAAIGPVILIFGNIATAAGALGITFAGVGTAISTVLGVVLGPVGLIAAGTALLLSWQPAREFLWDLGTRVFATLKRWTLDLINTFKSWWDQTEQTRAFLGNLAKVIIGDVVGSIKKLVASIKESIESGGFWSVVIDTITGSFKTLYQWGISVVRWVDDFVRSVRTSIETGGTWSVVVDTVVGVFEDLVGILRQLVPPLDWFLRKVDSWIDRAKVATESTQSAGRSFGDLGDSVDGATSSFGKSWAALDNLGESADDAGNSVKTAGGKVAEAGEKLSRTRIIITDVGRTLLKASASAKVMTGETITLVKATELLDAAFDDVSLSSKVAEKLLRELKKAYDQGKISLLQYERAIANVKKRIDDTNESIKEQGLAFEFANKAAKAYDRFMSTDLGRTLDGIGRHIGEIGNLAGELFGESAQREIEQWGEVLNLGLDAFASFASGDIVGGVVKGIGAVKQAFDNLFPSTKTVEERIGILIGHFQDGEGTLEHWNKLTYDLTKTLQKVAEDGWDAGRAADIMSENFGDFIDIAITMGDEGYDAIARIVEAANDAGVGLDTIAEELRATWDELSNVIEERNAFIVDQTSTMVDGLITMLGETGNVTRREIEFAGTTIVQAFNSMLNAGVPVIDIVTKLGDTFDLVNSQGQLMGIDLGEEFGNLGELFELLADEKIQRVIERLNGMTAAAEAAGNMGLLTTEQFDAWETRLSATFNKLIDGGASSEVALAALQGPLQTLFNMSQQYGFEVDANTQKLLDMALAQGVVTDMGMTQEDILITGFNKMIEALNRLIQALGGVPVALETWGRSADSLGDTMGGLGDRGVAIADHVRDAWDKATGAINSNSAAAEGARGNANTGSGGSGNRGSNRGGNESSSRVPQYNTGTGKFMDFGSGTLIEAHNKEEIITEKGGHSVAAMVGTAIETAMRIGGESMSAEFQRELLHALKDNTHAFREMTTSYNAMRGRLHTERM